MINNIPVFCDGFKNRDRACKIVQKYPAMYEKDEKGPGLNEYPVQLCLECGISMIETDEPVCLNCRSFLIKQDENTENTQPQGGIYLYTCNRCHLTYYAHRALRADNI
jgi:hypothetical protein